MIAVPLLKAKEYLPKLEEIGLKYHESCLIADVPHSVFITPKGKRVVYPGVRGENDDIPMIPASSIEHLYKKARWYMKQEQVLPDH